MNFTEQGHKIGLRYWPRPWDNAACCQELYLKTGIRRHEGKKFTFSCAHFRRGLQSGAIDLERGMI